MGPLENPCVASYRMVLEEYPVSVCRTNWSAKENEDLAKGLKQQLQETLIREATERSRYSAFLFLLLLKYPLKINSDFFSS